MTGNVEHVPLNLQQFFKENPRVALAFSGGVDSAYLLYAAKACGAEVTAYYLETEFQPQFERDDVHKLAQELCAKLVVIPLRALAQKQVRKNPPDRCYWCKQALFGVLRQRCEEDGLDTLIDGTNASDDTADRPGMRALAELSVRSPLRECGLTKSEIRSLSRAAGLFTHNKPSYACLATRIPAGQEITAEALQKVERAESALHRLGFSDLRVRVDENRAKIQLPEGQLEAALAHRKEILKALGADFSEIVLDMKGR